ncbi:PREDICTED: uncharacterized protein LOC104752905 [Camelina sativa]|uniref:Uncharacterized protein LOC104752905 n=1 Tax=Camelina sativa TaxID=90675 RepID=A0ABM0WN11_CAMSA|nr:PREDICTED: uncharacterized protein LOC104752905 [Camelina sativa]
MIIGQTDECPDSVRALKKRARQICNVRAISEEEELSTDPIAFTAKDAKGIHHPHNDPLVVEIRMDEFDVERVLVDTGSTVNVLFSQTLEKMGVTPEQIKPGGRMLTGYDGVAKTSMGDVKLQVQAGGVTRKTKFVVIDAPPIYNAILGSPWIYSMQADEDHSVDPHKPERDQLKATGCQIIQVNIDGTNPSQTVGIGAELDEKLKTELVAFLRSRSKTFAWSTKDMVGIDPSVTCHKLNTDPTFKPVRQKRRRPGADQAKAVQDEVERLLKADQIMEVQYPDWLANPVVVKKKNGKWRVCVDFTDLNKACPKDCFRLPHIDQLVEATAGNQLLSFMDAFSGYNQIAISPADREKTAFITDRGTYCYKVMPFGLKNAGATYQRLVNTMFADLLGKTMEVYIDDMLVKSLIADQHVQHLAECFDILDRFQMKLNPTKCTFGVTSGEFLGYIVTERGIELLRGNKDFHWDDACEAAFGQLKQYLTNQPVLVKPEEGETLYLYVSVSSLEVSGVLVRDDRGDQRPIFYISKALNDTETRYPTLEKLALALIVAARKLRPYFQSHSIVVLTDQPLRTVLHSPLQSGRIAKWAIELSEYDTELSPDLEETIPKDEPWTLFTDGSSSNQGSGVGIILRSPTGEVLEQVIKLGFKASNNETEYKAVVAGLRLAQGLGVTSIQFFCDSQFSGEYGAKNGRMEAYRQLLRTLSAQFTSFELIKVPRSENASADALAAQANCSDPSLQRTILIECIEAPSIDHAEVAYAISDAADPINVDPPVQEPVEVIQPSDDWQLEIKKYIEDSKVPEDRWQARRLKARCAHYAIMGGSLFRRSSSGVLLTCVDREEAERIMTEVHEGDGGNHSGGRALALKIKKDGHYEPCQRHRQMKHVPPELLSTVTAPYPFMHWAMDLVGPLPPSRSKKFLLVLTDYFTKWVEAELFTKIQSLDVTNFIWKNIICRHGLPYEIVTENGTQFTSMITRRFLGKWGIRLSTSTPRYPQETAKPRRPTKPS